MNYIYISFCSAILMFQCICSRAQSKDYYTRETLIRTESEVFKVEKKDGPTFVSYNVFNEKNTHDRMRVFKRDDGTIYFPGAELPVEKFHKALYATFSKARARALFKPYGEFATMGITYIVDSVDGKTLEVYFFLDYYLSDDEHAIFSMTPYELSMFESNLKEYVVWDIPQEFNSAPYCVISHSFGL